MASTIFSSEKRFYSLFYLKRGILLISEDRETRRMNAFCFMENPLGCPQASGFPERRGGIIGLNPLTAVRGALTMVTTEPLRACPAPVKSGPGVAAQPLR